MQDFDIKEELKKLPTSPGVYLMHKKDGEVIYVGKAKNLKNRVKQYFSDSYKKTNKILQMVSNIDYFEYVVVDNELESLILECNFIKEYRPRYNTLLKDDKSYPYIKITINEDFPRVVLAYRKYKDFARYFGPYRSASLVKEILDFIKKYYKIRPCSLKININDEKTKTLVANRECLYYHINMCLAPCINKNCKKEYDENLQNVIDFLSGNDKKIISDFTNKMIDASNKEDFESAIIYRNALNTINELSEKQKIDSKDYIDKDILGFYREDNFAVVQIFEVRDGNIVDRNTNILNIDKNDTDEEIMESFIKQYYNTNCFLPKEIWLETDINEKDLICEWLYKISNKKIKIIIPKLGDKEKLCKLATLNAKIQYNQQIKRYVKEKKDIEKAYEDLSNILNIKKLDRFESYDISNTTGVFNVASMVVFENGDFKKNEYRKFRLKYVTTANDYASMMEVIDRRINRYLIRDNKFLKLPDVFLIDGGIGHVNVVKEVLNNYDLDIKVVGMVKDDNHMTRGLVVDDEIIDLKKYKELFKLISNIQDETHRFAIEYHKTIRSKEQVHSVLDDIKGIGQKRRIALIKHFGNINNIKNATIDELSKVACFNKLTAKTVYDFFHN